MDDSKGNVAVLKSLAHSLTFNYDGLYGKIPHFTKLSWFISGCINDSTILFSVHTKVYMGAFHF